MPLRELLHQLVLEIGELEDRIDMVEKQLEALASPDTGRRATAHHSGHRSVDARPPWSASLAMCNAFDRAVISPVIWA